MTRVLSGTLGLEAVAAAGAAAVVEVVPAPTGVLWVRLIEVALAKDVTALVAREGLARGAGLTTLSPLPWVLDLGAAMGTESRAEASATGWRAARTASTEWISLGIPVVCTPRDIISPLG